MIDKKKIHKISVIIIISIVIIMLFDYVTRKTNAKYESESEMQKDIDVAFWITDNSIKTERILAENMYPSDTPYTYTFSVSNNNGVKKAEVTLEYQLSIQATTNLPLEYEFYKNGIKCNIIESIITDKYNTYYKKITIATDTNDLVLDPQTNKTDIIEMKIYFPIKYADSYKYADLITDLKIELIAKQKIN